MVEEKNGGYLAELLRQSSSAPAASDVIPFDSEGSEFGGNVGELIPEGTWVYVKLVKAVQGSTNSKMINGQEQGNKPKLEIEYVVQDGPYKNRHLWKSYFLWGKAGDMYLSLCDALGQYDKTNRKPLASVPSLTNQFLWVKVGLDTGRPKNPELPDGEKWADRNIVAPWNSHEPANSRLRAPEAYGAHAPTVTQQDPKPVAKPPTPGPQAGEPASSRGKSKWEDDVDKED